MRARGRTAREKQLRTEMVEAGRRMHALGVAAGSDGNLSARLDDDLFLITPSGFSKGFLHPEQLLVVNLAGELQPSFHPMRRTLRPSTEMFMHLEAYRQRPDVLAVIHAHPPMGIACTVANISLASCVLPEVIYHLGSIPTAPYATPGTAEGAASVRELVKHHEAMLLDHHGSLTLGDTLLTALMRLEWIEQAATIMLAAHAATEGQVAELPRERVERLQSIRHLALTERGRAESAPCSACQIREATPPPVDAELVRAITEAVLHSLNSQR
ncbi:MAG: class II aldolase/adducin family protein [Ardenticatenales bacterium]|nr:class II aldolase/adducin family protein [Ardenticatenales bacterium]